MKVLGQDYEHVTLEGLFDKLSSKRVHVLRAEPSNALSAAEGDYVQPNSPDPPAERLGLGKADVNITLAWIFVHYELTSAIWPGYQVLHLRPTLQQ